MSYGIETLNQSQRQSPTRSRMTLVLIFALFFLPFVLAWVMNFFGDWVPESTTNHGALIDPVQPLAVTQLTGLDGQAIAAEVTEGKWALVYFHQGVCGEDCHNAMYVMRQVRLAQGKNIDRVARITVINGETQWAEDALAHYPGMLFTVPGRGMDAKTTFAVPNQIYLLDPLGNLMMHYPLTVEPRGMIKDLERLLRISYVG